MDFYDILIFLSLALLSEIAGTLGGFGSSLFFVPLAGFFFDFTSVLALTAIFHVFSNLFKIFLFGKYTNLRILILVGLPGILMVFIGAVLTTFINTFYIEIILGIFLIVFSTFLF
ncbi:MAG: TSUP family transporter, partial [Chitinophagales bacterium]